MMPNAECSNEPMRTIIILFTCRLYVFIIALIDADAHSEIAAAPQKLIGLKC